LLVGASCEAVSTAEEEPEVLVEELGLSHLGCLVLEGDSLYYTALETTPGLVKLPLTGGQPHVLASDVGDACFVLHQDTFYLAAPGDPVDDGPDSRILSVPLVGGAPTVLAEGVDADKLAVQGSRIFMLGLGDAGITWIPIAGGTPVQLLDDPDPYIKDFVVDHENVYYAAGDEWNRATEVKRIPLGGGEPVIMADCGNHDRIHALGQDDVSIYVSFGTRTEEDEHHVLDRIPKDGGEATHVGTWMGGRPHMIHVTETHVYVSEDWVGRGSTPLGNSAATAA